MPVIIDGTLGVNAAAVTTTSWNPTNLVIPGNSTIGDASSDTLTVNATPTFNTNVGIGTSSANRKLHVYAGASGVTLDSAAGAVLEHSTHQYLVFASTVNTQQGLIFSGASFNDASITWEDGSRGNALNTNLSTGSIATWSHGASERMRIDSSGNVSIGSAHTVDAKLDVQGDTFKQLRLSTTASGSGQILYAGSVANTIGSYIGNNAYYDTNYLYKPNYASASVIQFGSDGSTSFMNDTGLTSGTNYTPSVRLNITNSGRIGVGTVSPETHFHISSSAGSSTPATTGTTTAGVILRAQNANSNLVLDIGGNAGYGAWLQSTNRTDLTLRYPIQLNPLGGAVYVGATSQLNGFTNKLVIGGAITAGTDTATAGSVMLQNAYGNGSTANIGTDASSGGIVLGYCVTPKSGSPVAFSSATTFGSAAPAAYVLRDYHMWLTSPANQNLATIGPDVTLTSAMCISQSGKIAMGSGWSAPTSTLDIFGLQANTSSTSANLPTGTLRLGFDGGAAAGNYGASLVFTQRWFGSSNASVAVGQIAGIKVAGDGNFGGGLALFTSNATNNDLKERMRIDNWGKVNIGSGGSTSGRLYVDGAVVVSGTWDPSITQSFTGMNQTVSGTIVTTSSCSGSFATGKTIYIKYEATTWKSWSIEVDLASTNGFCRVIGGGYCNGSVSGGLSKIYEYGSMIQSLALEANPSNSQAVWVKLTVFAQTHPHIAVRFTTSGGEGAADPSKLSIIWTN